MRHHGHALQPLTLSVPGARRARCSLSLSLSLLLSESAAWRPKPQDRGSPQSPTRAWVLVSLRQRREGARALRHCLHRH